MVAVATVNTRRGHADVVDFPGVVITGRQELNRKDDRDEVTRSLPRTGHYTPSTSWAARLMISWDLDAVTVVPASEWAHLLTGDAAPDVVDELGVGWRAHGGRVLVSPARGVIGTCLEVADVGRVVFLNTHMVSSAWSKRRVPGKKWRRRQWRKHKQLLDHITATLTAAGFLVVLVGDFNHGPVLAFPGLEPAGGGDRPGYDQIHASPDLNPRRFRRADGANKHQSDHYPRAADIGPKEAPMPTITERFVAALRDEGITVLDHDDWGSQAKATYATRRRTKPHRLLPGKPSDTLWQHVTVTRPTADPAADFRVVERIGVDRFGSGVSYNVMVHPTGVVGIGQPLDAKGTHTVNDKGIPGFSFDQNFVALAVAWIGVVGDDPTPEVLDAIAATIRALIKIGALTPGFDYEPHSLVAAKDCPLQSMRSRMDAIRRAGTDQPPKPNRVQRAQVQAEELVKTIARAKREAASIAGLLDETPETRTQVHAWADELEKTAAALKEIRIDVRDDADRAPEK